MISTVVIFSLFVLLSHNVVANTPEAPSDLILIHIVSNLLNRSHLTALGF